MLTFLRKIRKSLIESGSARRYVLYALGETFLVVIVILIALQINNWNQERIYHQDEKRLLSNLHIEFERVSEELEPIIRFFESGLSASKSLSLMCDARSPSYKPDMVDSLVTMSFNHYPVVISQPIYEDLLNSEKLSKLSNDQIKNEVYGWKQLINVLNTSSQLLSEWTRTEITPYFVKHGSFKNLDVFFKSQGFTQKSTLIDNYDHLFVSLEFENLIQNKIYFLSNCINQLNGLREKAFLLKDLTLKYQD